MQFKQLQDDMIAAMKARDKVRKDAISTLVSAAKKVAIDEGCRDDIREELVDRVILKEIKSVKEQIDTCPASREDLLAEYKTRYDIFMEYAPKMMSAGRGGGVYHREVRGRGSKPQQRTDHEGCYAGTERQGGGSVINRW